MPRPDAPSPKLDAAVMELWLEDACTSDMDSFVKALTTFRSNGVQPELMGSVIAHYASKWLLDISRYQHKSSETSATSSWMKKRLFVQTLVDFLPQEQQTVPCGFLLKLLKAGNMVGVESAYLSQIEKRVAFQLDHATIEELMIPSFRHSCATLLDIELVRRLVHIFLELGESAKSGSALDLSADNTSSRLRLSLEYFIVSTKVLYAGGRELRIMIA